MRSTLITRTTVVLMSLIVMCGVAFAGSGAHQEPASGPENAAIKKLNDATDPAVKLDAAAEFVKKFPKSGKRLEIANHVAGNIDEVEDATKRVTLAEKALTIFTLPDENDVLTRSVLDAYLSAGRAADAFRVAAAWLPKHPDEADPMRRLAITANNESIKGNNTFISQDGTTPRKQSRRSRPPANPGLDAARGLNTRRSICRALSRAAILACARGQTAARTSAEKAVALKSPDPMIYSC